jgi:leucyl/phenylalanyl-tRNA--protein transferase
MIHILSGKLEFPSAEDASSQGIVAVGGDLSSDRLLLAYKSGIFPWYNEHDPIIWWSLDPRMVLYPRDLKVSKSMRPYFNQQKYRVTFNQAFGIVIRNCKASQRGGQEGTWITGDIVEAYEKLHELGYAKSVEVWEGHDLVGGLYGVDLGRVFCGESMFSYKSNASKFGFISLVKKLEELDYRFIDCQQDTQHLRSLGASPIPRKRFLKELHEAID